MHLVMPLLGPCIISQLILTNLCTDTCTLTCFLCPARQVPCSTKAPYRAGPVVAMGNILSHGLPKNMSWEFRYSHYPRSTLFNMQYNTPGWCRTHDVSAVVATPSFMCFSQHELKTALQSTHPQAIEHTNPLQEPQGNSFFNAVSLSRILYGLCY